MNLFNVFKRPDINQGIEDFRKSNGAVLLDVRTPGEYREGHVPGSKNVPLQDIDNIDSVVENIDTVLYVYCHSGVRSAQAVEQLKELGYTKVNNIGGIAAYTGKVER